MPVKIEFDSCVQAALLWKEIETEGDGFFDPLKYLLVFILPIMKNHMENDGRRKTRDGRESGSVALGLPEKKENLTSTVVRKCPIAGACVAPREKHRRPRESEPPEVEIDFRYI